MRMDFFSQDQLFLLYIVSLFFIAYIKYTNSGFLKNNLLAVLNYNTALQFQKSEVNNKSLINNFLSVNFYLSVSIFSVYILNKFNLIPENINHFLLFVGIILILIILVYLNAVINLFSAFIFNIKDIAGSVNLNSKYFYHAFGLIIFIINIFISFSSISNIAFYIGIICFALFYLLRILRFIKINLSKQMNSFYLFLYLCTVEILPILYVIKIFTIYHATTN